MNFKDFRSTAVSTIYTKAAEKVKLPVNSVLLQLGDTVIDAEGVGLIGDLTPNPAVELVVRTDVLALTLTSGTETWNIRVLRSNTGAQVYKMVSERFKLEAGSFAIEVLRRPLPDTETPLDAQFPPSFATLALDVTTGPSVVVILPEGDQLTFRVAPDFPIFEFYSRVAVRLQQSWEQFHFSPAEFILIVHDSMVKVKDMLPAGNNVLTLRLVPVRSIVRMNVTGPDGSKMLLGFPPATTTEVVYRRINQLYPNTVVFLNNMIWLIDNSQPKTAGNYIFSPSLFSRFLTLHFR